MTPNPKHCWIIASLALLYSAPPAYADLSKTHSFSMVCEQAGNKLLSSHDGNDSVSVHDDVLGFRSWSQGLLRYDYNRGSAEPASLTLAAAPTFDVKLKAQPESGSISVSPQSGSIMLAGPLDNLLLVRHPDGTWRGAWTKVGLLPNMERGAGHSVTYTAMICHDSEGREGRRR